jgi:hypothetical protein
VTKPLALARFRAIVAAYGAKSELWPEAERAAALALCAASAEARALLAEEAELDGVLASALPPPAPDLLRRLNEVPLRTPQHRAWWPFQRAWVPVLGWAFAALLGLGCGLGLPFEQDEPDVVATVASAGTSAPDSTPADDELAALVSGSLAEFTE